MKIALLGTGFGQAHAAVYAQRPDVDEVVVFGRTPEKLAKISDQFGFATSTDLDAVITDPSVDLVDICLPTRLHTEVAVRAMQAGKDVLIEVPLAATLEDARRVVATQQATGRRAFVDMGGRFDPATELLHTTISDGRYGPLKALRIDTRTALLWEGYQLGLDSIAMDVLHSATDTVVRALGRPTTTTAIGVGKDTGGSAAEVLLTYPDTIVHCSASALMPKPYGLRGGYQAAFTDAVIESAWSAGWDGRPTTTVTEYTDAGARNIDLPAVDAYTAVIDHVLACLTGHAGNLIEPASALPALELTLDVHQRLNQPAG